MLGNTLDGEYKGFARLLLIMYAIQFIFAFINYLPQIGVSSTSIPIILNMGPLILGIWYIGFVIYLVKNR